MWKDTIEIGNMTEVIVKGEPVQSMVYREIYTNKKSVRQSEFYQAAVAGLKPELVFEIRSLEYNNDKKLRYPAGSNGITYDIIRTYDRGEIIELTVSSFVGGAM